MKRPHESQRWPSVMDGEPLYRFAVFGTATAPYGAVQNAHRRPPALRLTLEVVENNHKQTRVTIEQPPAQDYNSHSMRLKHSAPVDSSSP